MLDNKIYIAARLKEARIKLCVNSGDFALKSGIDPRNYSSIETGKRAVGERILRDICSAFPIDINWLLTGDGEMLKGDSQSSTEAVELNSIKDELIASLKKQICLLEEVNSTLRRDAIALKKTIADMQATAQITKAV